jgi:hypothetical protein
MSLWDAAQREWLQAMGYSLMVLAGDEAVEAAAPASRAGAGDAVPGLGGEDVVVGTGTRQPVDTAPGSRAARSARPVPPAPELVQAGPSPVDVTATEPPPRPRTDAAAKAAALEAARAGAAGRHEGPLWDALVSATGQPPALAARTLRGLGVDLAALRADPAAKRALWPRLRRLRRPAAP